MLYCKKKSKCIACLIVLLIPVLHSDLLGEKSKAHPSLVFSGDTYYPINQSSETYISSSLGYGFSTTFNWVIHDQSCFGIFLSYISNHYSIAPSYYFNETSLNMNYSAVILGGAFKFYENGKIIRNRTFFIGKLGYSMPLNHNDYNGTSLTNDNSWIVAIGAGYSIPFSATDALEIALEFYYMTPGFKSIAKDNSMTASIKFSIGYNVDL